MSSRDFAVNEVTNEESSHFDGKSAEHEYFQPVHGLGQAGQEGYAGRGAVRSFRVHNPRLEQVSK